MICWGLSELLRDTLLLEDQMSLLDLVIILKEYILNRPLNVFKHVLYPSPRRVEVKLTYLGHVLQPL